MKLSNISSARKRGVRLLCSLLAVGEVLFPLPGLAATAVVALPATPIGELGTQLVHHINTDTPAQVTQWATGVLSASIPAADKADFVANVGSAARDSGGVDLFDVRTDPRRPGRLRPCRFCFPRALDPRLRAVGAFRRPDVARRAPPSRIAG